MNPRLQALKDSDAVILLEPAGHSSLAEAGIAYGMRKKVVLIGLVDHPEVVYRICTSRCPTVDAFLADIDGRVIGINDANIIGGQSIQIEIKRNQGVAQERCRCDVGRSPR